MSTPKSAQPEQNYLYYMCPTLKQTKTAELTMDNIGLDKPLTKGQVLEKVKYSPAIQKNPKAVYDTEGYKKAEDKLLKDNGIDFNSRLSRLAEIFHDKDKRAVLGANKEITSMLGEYKQTDVKAVALFDKLEKDLKDTP